ncbi:uncharacterized protein TA02755 [Theileria annulata]|uniref:Uncharacterized protein n=1 Tax=Theileria annulata TaxID=5874 RepID=Q4UHM3_THEAN|nr:uncharacterized protein TA02755 [Theileria annulata]CAI73416.1 hypothetical protein TA02755 [Theileria annulata]|eukprot:XP_954093.1 hypothetical protein TA02755 [Theileria annulata]
MIFNIIFIFFIYNKFFINTININNNLKDNLKNNNNNLNNNLKDNLNEILLEKQKFIGNNKKIIKLFNRNNSSVTVSGPPDSTTTLGKGANFTLMECTLGKGANFTAMECNTEETPIGVGGTVGRGPYTVTEGLERKKNILMKFGNTLNKYDTTTTYSPNYPNTPNSTGGSTTTTYSPNGMGTNGTGYGYDQMGQPQQPMAPNTMASNPMGQSQPVNQPMDQGMVSNPMTQPVNQPMVQPMDNSMVPNPMNPMGNPMNPMNSMGNPMNPMNPMTNGTDSMNPMMQPYQNVPEGYPNPNYIPQQNMNNNEKDIHDNIYFTICNYFFHMSSYSSNSFFFPECSKPTNSIQNQSINTPIPQQYCNTYSNKLPNLNYIPLVLSSLVSYSTYGVLVSSIHCNGIISEFKMNDNKWLLIKENNLICLTRSQPVDTFQFIEFKDNFCNKFFFSSQILLVFHYGACYIPLRGSYSYPSYTLLVIYCIYTLSYIPSYLVGLVIYPLWGLNENSIGGLMIRCNENQRTLIELNSLIKTISLKLFNQQHIITLLEIPYLTSVEYLRLDYSLTTLLDSLDYLYIIVYINVY